MFDGCGLTFWGGLRKGWFSPSWWSKKGSNFLRLSWSCSCFRPNFLSLTSRIGYLSPASLQMKPPQDLVLSLTTTKEAWNVDRPVNREIRFLSWLPTTTTKDRSNTLITATECPICQLASSFIKSLTKTPRLELPSLRQRLAPPDPEGSDPWART